MTCLLIPVVFLQRQILRMFHIVVETLFVCFSISYHVFFLPWFFCEHDMMAFVTNVDLQMYLDEHTVLKLRHVYSCAARRVSPASLFG